MEQRRYFSRRGDESPKPGTGSGAGEASRAGRRQRRSTTLLKSFQLLFSLVERKEIGGTLKTKQPAAIGEGQHRARLQARRHGENMLDLLRAQHRRQLLRLLDVPDLGRDR